MPALLTDFGLARAAGAGGTLTRTGAGLGTPAYMSPEQARGETRELTPASDVWSLGCVLYELLAGRRAFDGTHPAEVLAASLSGTPPRPRALRHGLPPGLDGLFAAALAVRPAARYETARALAADLDRLLAGHAPRGRSRSPRLALAVGVASTVALAGSLLLSRTLHDARPDASAGRSRAEMLAVAGWADRVSDPAAGERRLSQALRDQPGRDDWRVRHGLLLWALGRGSAARAAWAEVTRPPASADARFWEAIEPIFRWEGGRLRGDLAAPRLRALQPTVHPRGAIVRAWMAAQAGDWDAARARLRSIPGWEAALLRGLLESEARDGDPAAATRAYDTALDEGPGFAWAYSNRGVLHTRLGDPARGAADQRRALAIDPTHAPAWFNLAHGLEDLDDPAGAAAAYARAVAVAPGWHLPRVNLALLHCRQGREAEAERVLDQATADGFDCIEIRAARVGLRIRRGDLAGGIADAEWVLEREPTHAVALHNLASAHFTSGDLSEALRIADLGCAAHPTHADLLTMRGQVHAAAGRHADAVRDFTSALAADPAHAVAWFSRGDSHAALRDPARSRDDFTRAIALAPEDPKARYNRGNACLALGDRVGAIEDYTAALALAPAHWNSRFNRGIAHLQLGDGAAAEADFRAAHAARPDHDGAWVNHAIALLALDRVDEAEAELRACLAQARSPDAAVIARTQLAACEARRRSPGTR